MSLTNHPILTAALTVLGAYLVGSISFAVIFSKLFVKKDVRNFGSGNAGMTNVMRVAGALPGLLTFIFDMAKGFASAYFGRIIFSNLYEATENLIYSPLLGSMICALVCLLGHVFPVFFRFRGGKGVATGVGAYLVICPIAAAIGFGVFLITFLISGIISISSLLGTAAVVLGTAFFALDTQFPILPQIIVCLLTGGIIFAKHKENIVRLIKGEEKKLKIKRKNKED